MIFSQNKKMYTSSFWLLMHYFSFRGLKEMHLKIIKSLLERVQIHHKKNYIPCVKVTLEKLYNIRLPQWSAKHICYLRIKYLIKLIVLDCFLINIILLIKMSRLLQ